MRLCQWLNRLTSLADDHGSAGSGNNREHDDGGHTRIARHRRLGRLSGGRSGGRGSGFRFSNGSGFRFSNGSGFGFGGRRNVCRLGRLVLGSPSLSFF